MKRTHSFMIAALLATAGSHSVIAGITRPVALTGTDGPLGPGLGPGVRFANFGMTGSTQSAPSLTGTGSISFVATLTGSGIAVGNNEALYVTRGNGLEVLARTGSHAAGLDSGITYTSFVSEAALSDSGNTAFLGVVAGPGVNNDTNDCFWAEPPTGGGLALMVRETTTIAPGTPGVLFGDQANPNWATPTMWGGYNPIMSTGGIAMQRCGIRSPNGGPQWGIWHDPTGPLTDYLIRDGVIPGITPTSTLGAASTWLINSHGATILAMGESNHGSGIWTTRALDGNGMGTDGVGPFNVVAYSGQTAPGSISTFEAFTHWSQNKHGRVSFSAAFSGVPFSAGGIWSDGRFGALQSIALSGSIAPGSGTATFTNFGIGLADEVLIADNNATVFMAHLAQNANVGTGNDQGIWSTRTTSGGVGNLRKVFRESDPVPSGLGADYEGLVFLAPINFWVNASGRTAFFVNHNDFTRAIWVEQPDGSLTPIVKEFTLFDVLGDGSDMRLVSSIIPIGSSASSGDGRRTMYNDQGDFVFRLKFADGSEGIFTTAPAPVPPCGTSDFNGDGDFGTDSDIEAFFACLAGNCCGTCYPGGSDFNADGDFGTDADIESFFRVLAGGAC